MYNDDRKLYKVKIKSNPGYAEMRSWCIKNCENAFYVLPGWAGPGCEFHNENDAIMFALRWS